VTSLLLEDVLREGQEGDVPLSEAERKALRGRFRHLEKDLDRALDENHRLREELRRSKAAIHLLVPDDQTAAAWGVPSSRVYYRRTVREELPKPAGGQVGHPGHARPRPVPNSPPLRLSLAKCPDCNRRLGAPFEIRRRTITDLPPPEPLIFDVEIPRYHCPGCHHRVEPIDPFPPTSSSGSCSCLGSST
jgi:transposase